ncbi:hypothetical protein Pelo_3230 [Pelomyxa schiedti]|nr:hypothetical protein Pelo_3230 [Pelomyxa schiedti]
MDETMLPYRITQHGTYAEVGSTRVEVPASTEKRGVTATFTITKSGTLLPMQVIYSGLTNSSIPTIHWPHDVLTCYGGASGKHTTVHGQQRPKPTKWQNRRTLLLYLDSIVAPYLAAERAKSLLQGNPYPQGNRAVMKWDHHWSHIDKHVQARLAELDIDMHMITKKATDLFSVLDISINKAAKSEMRKLFSAWCTEEITMQLGFDVHPSDVQLSAALKLLKPLHANWMVSVFQVLKRREKELISTGFQRAHDNIELCAAGKGDQLQMGRHTTDEPREPLLTQPHIPSSSPPASSQDETQYQTNSPTSAPTSEEPTSSISVGGGLVLFGKRAHTGLLQVNDKRTQKTPNKRARVSTTSSPLPISLCYEVSKVVRKANRTTSTPPSTISTTSAPPLLTPITISATFAPPSQTPITISMTSASQLMDSALTQQLSPIPVVACPAPVVSILTDPGRILPHTDTDGYFSHGSDDDGYSSHGSGMDNPSPMLPPLSATDT